MRSALPKVMHVAAGRTLIGHVLAAATGLDPERVIVIKSPGDEAIRREIERYLPRAVTADQQERRGTGHAVMMAGEKLAGFTGTVLTLFGDCPNVRPETLRRLIATLDAGTPLSVLGFEAADPKGYGRLILDRGGALTAIREELDASPKERAQTLCNSGIMAIDSALLERLLPKIGTGNAKGEIYLTDLVELAIGDDRRVGHVVCPEDEVRGVNTREQLARVSEVLQRRLRERAMADGATLVAPDTVFLSADTRLGRDVVIEPHVIFGPGVEIADRVTVRGFCHIEGTRIGEGAVIGPFARLRPETTIAEDAHIGNFVEVKKATIGRGVKANHLAYLGDARVGAGANIGAGAITCNYDGFGKYLTEIGEAAFIGSNSSLVAPVKIGDRAYVGSGSVVSRDVDADALAIERAEFQIKTGLGQALPRNEGGAQGPRREVDPGRHDMCGIVGILGSAPVARPLIEALRRLEYRGYDSAGIATIEQGRIERLRAPGKLAELARKLDGCRLEGTTGIGHTRWATHGAPTETNAHPHVVGGVAVVHNGIIENFRELKSELSEAGVKFATETDTEVVAHLVSRSLAQGSSPEEAVRQALRRLKGAFALAFLFAGREDLMIAARHGPPLAIGHGEGQMFLGSDAIALAPFTNRVTYLEDGDWAVLSRDASAIFDAGGRGVARAMVFTQASSLLVDKGGHRHFMAKEIAEQPEVVGHTLAEYVDFAERKVKLPVELPFDFAALDRITITACGTAHIAGLVAKYWFERVARLPVDVDIASEFRYREAPLAKNGLAILVSQSGETADTLAALRYCKEQRQHTLAIPNVPESTIARESDLTLRTFAGPEIGVASTKAFTCQLTVLAVLAIAAGKARGALGGERESELVDALAALPRHLNAILRDEKHIADVARRIATARDVLFLGRGINYPIALEGALKLKEISYIHAEGYAAGELKHGPIALIDENLPVIVIAPRDDLYDKTVSNMEEVAARGGRIVLLTDSRGAEDNATRAFDIIRVPEADPFIAPFLYTVPVQLLAYHAAVAIGTDVDQPRNLAKSVTVE